MKWLTRTAVAWVAAGLMTAAASADHHEQPATDAGIASRLYVEALVGYSDSESVSYGCCDFEIETGSNFGATLGYELHGGWALEVETLYAHLEYGGCVTVCAETDFQSSVNGLSIMANLVYEFDTDWFADPYVGVGLGATRIEYDGAQQFPAYSGEEWTEGYQIMIGGIRQVSERMSVFAEYRRNDVFSGVMIKTVDNIDIQSDSFSVGARLDF